MVCVGVLGPFFWTGDAKVWLAVPTSVFAMVLLPIAYVVFALMMNNKTILGGDMPTGGRRILWNVLMTGLHHLRHYRQPLEPLVQTRMAGVDPLRSLRRCRCNDP
jgi:hypothetical protein